MKWRAKGFDPERPSSYHVALLVSAKNCGLSTLDLIDGRLLSYTVVEGLVDSTDALNSLLSDSQTPKQPALLSAILCPSQSALLPELLASEEEGNAHLQLLHGELMDGSLRNRRIEENSARFYFRHPLQLEQQVFEKWPSAMLYPLQMQLTRSAMSRVKHGRYTLLVHCIDDRLDLVLAASQGPLLVNSFFAKSAEDVLYYALYALEQCEIDIQDVEAYLTGPQMSQAYAQLMEEYLPLSTQQKSPPSEGEAFRSRFLCLAERHKCVS